MDRTIPAGAAILLKFIYKTEVSREAPECYDVIYGHNQDKLSKSITKMTIGEIQASQAGWSKRFGSSATGAAQFMRTTLHDLVIELKLSTSTLFGADLQDRLAYHLLKRRGYTDYMSGKISRTEFGKGLAREWASFPVLAGTKGANRTVARGQSYYAGDGVNKSLTLPSTVEAVLDQVKRAGNGVQASATSELSAVVFNGPELVTTNIIVDAVKTIPKAPDVVSKIPRSDAAIFAIIWTTIATFITASSVWFSSMPCDLLGLACGK